MSVIAMYADGTNQDNSASDDPNNGDACEEVAH